MIVPILQLDSGEQFQPRGVETAQQCATIASRPFDLAALPVGGGRMDFPDGQQDVPGPQVFYHRTVRQYGLWWQQFWFWYLMNPWNVGGFGVHEGDWEFVQIATTDTAGDDPVLMTASQHHTGQAKEFWTVEQRNGRPVIYVARGSHANYYHPLEVNENLDITDGLGALIVQPEIRPFSTWATWPGLWGNSIGVGRSPQSPGCQLSRWHTPALFHSQASR